MSESRILPLREPLQHVIELLKVVRSDLRKKAADGTTFDWSTEVEDTGATITEVIASLEASTGAFEKLLATASPLIPPKLVISTAATSLVSIGAQLEHIHSRLDSAPKSVVSTGKLDFISSSGTVESVHSAFLTLTHALDEVLIAWSRWRSISQSPKFRDFQSYLSEMEGGKATIEEHIAKAQRHADSTSILVDNILSKNTLVDSAFDNVNNLQEQSQTIVDQISKIRQDSDAFSVKIVDAKDAAEGLLQSMKETEANFKSIDVNTRDRAQEIKDISEKLENNELIIINQLADIKSLNKQASDMLAGATNSGLAGSYSQYHKVMEKETASARRGFYLCILLLIVSTVPLLVYLVPPAIIEAIFGASAGAIATSTRLSVTGDPATDAFVHLIPRILLLVPAIWATRFAAARHERAFRLRENYAYKYTVAASVDGFKKQSPGQGDLITAMAFQELAFNPASRMEVTGDETKHSNPILQKLLERLGATHDGQSA